MTTPEFLTCCSFAATGLGLAWAFRRIGGLRADLDDAHRKLARVQGAQDNTAVVARRAEGKANKAADGLGVLNRWVVGKFQCVGRTMEAIRDEALCQGKGPGPCECGPAFDWAEFVEREATRRN